MTAAEKKAAALPPTLTVPMILFFLPGLFAAILTPAMVQINGWNWPHLSRRRSRPGFALQVAAQPAGA